MNLPLRIALCQHQSHEDPEVCWLRFQDQAEEAARGGATLIVSQELFLAPYFCQGQDSAAFDLAESIPGPTTERLQELSKRLGCVVVGSLFEKRAPGLYHLSALRVGLPARE